MPTHVEVNTAGPVATLRFVSDIKANLLSRGTLESLAGQMTALAGQTAIRVWIITGSGTTFLAGADIKELAGLDGPEAARQCGRFGKQVLGSLADAPAVSIAAINGAALGGGCELAMACDFRLIAPTAKIGLPETSLGVIPGWGGTQRLARLVGPGRAKEMILTGQVISAEQAAAIGLVNQVVADGDVLAAAGALAGRVLAAGPQAVRLARQAIDRGLEQDLAGGLEIETALFAECFAGPESAEGLAAFIQKRKPNWVVS